MILDELLIWAFLTSITIISADPGRPLSRSLNWRLYLPCVAQVMDHTLFLMSRKVRMFKFLLLLILHTAGIYEIYEYLHHTKISRYTVPFFHPHSSGGGSVYTIDISLGWVFPHLCYPAWSEPMPPKWCTWGHSFLFTVDSITDNPSYVSIQYHRSENFHC